MLEARASGWHRSIRGIPQASDGSLTNAVPLSAAPPSVHRTFPTSVTEGSAAERHPGIGTTLRTLERRTPVDLVRLYALEDDPLAARTGIIAVPIAFDAGQRRRRQDRRRGPRRLDGLE